MKKENLQIIVYTEKGHTYTFYDVTDLHYHTNNLKFNYGGFSGRTAASFNNVCGITKHYGQKNPHIKWSTNKEDYEGEDK